MKTLQEVIMMLESRIDHSTLEHYIARNWLRPISSEEGWRFEEIDIARLQLVWDLKQNIQINDEGIDVVLSLLDQLYGLRAHIQKVTHAIVQQPEQIQTDIMMILKNMDGSTLKDNSKGKR